MLSQRRRSRGVRIVLMRFFVVIVACSVLVPLSPAQAEAIGERTRSYINSVREALHAKGESRRQQDFATTQQVQDPSQAARQVSHFHLCPRRVLLYVGEDFTLSPVPIGQGGEVVQGVSLQWSSR